MRCLYCQNHPWSQDGAGRALAAAEFEEVFRRLWAAGCHNWNLVSPTPWLPQVVEALAALRSAGVRLPVVYNTSGFERVETLRALERWVDIYLPDLRYARAATAAAGSETPAYPKAARAALVEMVRQKGPLRTEEDGVAREGVICRILVLPGFAEEAVENLEWLAAAVGTDIAVSVMAQYVPAGRAVGREPWGRKVGREEYERVTARAEALGFSRGWMQEYEAEAPDHLIGYRMTPAE